ncbi:MAG: hypothetical protein NTU69_00590 [Proteobacteria bacterium]|jgi:hypothetical protein|nr:hypothetical protein [Pseudomonadota bacterium]
MEQKNFVIENKIRIIRDKLAHRDSFTISDIGSVLDEKKANLYWTVWNLAQKGYIHKIGKGLYSFQEKEQNVRPILSPLGNTVLKILHESGYEFFVSGLDILSVFMEHVPESYSVLLYGSKYSINEINDLLSKNNVPVVVHQEMRNYQPVRQMPSFNGLVLLYATNEFSYSENGLASFEKAFIDLYYEVTRREYPLPLQELARIYINMKRRLSLDTNRLVKIASRRSIHYDIRYIIERDLISEKALEFVALLKKQE